MGERGGMTEGYVWLHHGIEETEIPEKIREYVVEGGRKAVCICGAGLKEGSVAQEQLILDERYVEYGLVIERETLRLAGGINRRLRAKREYELALRVAQTEKTEAISTDAVLSEKMRSDICMEAEAESDPQDKFCTDAYVTGRYFSRLKEWGLTESVLEALIAECGLQEEPERAQRFLEEMISHSAEYHRIYRATQPVLIYTGPSYCYNILNSFVHELGRALEKLGYVAEYYDTEREDVGGAGRLLGQQYRASVGFQTWMMSVKLDGGKRMLQDLVGGPKFNFIVDHPVWLDGQLKETPAHFHALTHDRNYVRFIREYYPNVSGVHLLPPGGRDPGEPDRDRKRENDLVFLGTYRNYRSRLQEIRDYPGKARFLASRFLGILKNMTELTPEQALKEALTYYGIRYEAADFRTLLFELRLVIQLVMYYYRENVIRSVLDAGLAIHVYGDSWVDSPFAGHAGLIVHPEIPAGESMGLLESSKISLNIMAWHKDGFTERVADSMLAGAVVVSDYSTQLAECYGEETVLFDLKRLGQLPGMLKELLANPAKRTAIAERAREKALRCATWERRGEELLKLVEMEESPKG